MGGRFQDQLVIELRNEVTHSLSLHSQCSWSQLSRRSEEKMVLEMWERKGEEETMRSPMGARRSQSDHGSSARNRGGSMLAPRR